MKLIRLAVLSLGDRSDASWQWKIPIGDVVLFMHRVEERRDSTQILIRAEIDLERTPELRGNCVLVPTEPRILTERTIEDFADRAAIAMRTRRSLSSPSPEAAFANLSDGDRALFESTEGICARGRYRHRLWQPFDLTAPSFDRALEDRRDGLSLLAEALASGHATGRFRELVRFFERAFARKPGALIQPLSRFLNHFTELHYTEAEVSRWIDVRHAATHADRRDFVVESEVRPVLTRVEQAAYDVLLNKKTWRDGTWDRRDEWTPVGGVLVDDSSAVVVRGATPVSLAQLFDAFGVYPLNLRLPRLEPMDGWWARIQGLDDHGRRSQPEPIRVVESLR